MILLVLLTMLHATVANESNEGDRNVNGSWTDTCAITDPQANLPFFCLSEMYNCSAFMDIFVHIVWQYQEQLLYGILSAIFLIIICYLKFGNLDEENAGDNHVQVDDNNADDDGGADDDGDFGRHYDSRNNVVQFPTAVSETRPFCQSLPGFTSSMTVEKESSTGASKNSMVLIFALIIFIVSTRPTSISSSGSTDTSACATTVIHFQSSSGLILPIEVFGSPSESPSSADNRLSNVVSLADIDQREEAQDFGTSSHTEVQDRPPDNPIISEGLNIFTPRRKLLVQPAHSSPFGLNSHEDSNIAANKGHKESEETLNLKEENLSATSDDKGSKISPTISKSLTHGDKEHVVAREEFPGTTCAVDMNVAQEPIEKLPSSDSDQNKVVSEDVIALQQPGDPLDSPSDFLPPPGYRRGKFPCSMDENIFKLFQSQFSSES